MFPVAARAGARSGRFAGQGGFSMAGDTQPVHNLPGLECPLFFFLLDTSLHLGEQIMTGPAIIRRHVLMPTMRKENIALLSRVQDDFFRTLVDVRCTLFHIRKSTGAEYEHEKQAACSHIFNKMNVLQGVGAPPSPVNWHDAKSMGCPHEAQVCARSNSSENISFSSPHLLHLQVNDLRCLKLAYPGQC